jgi:hypothetical protein
MVQPRQLSSARKEKKGRKKVGNCVIAKVKKSKRTEEYRYQYWKNKNNAIVFASITRQ